jgi:lipoate-protein ligase A
VSASLILWCDGAHDAAENMRRDAALLAAAGPGRPAVLRLFRFAPPGITLGASQQPGRELDLERCRADGIGWAVRPTGGRAIFHADEWTYALAAAIDDPRWGGSLAVAYDRMSAVLVASLAALGVPVRLAGTRTGDGDERPRRGLGPAAPCFASTTRHEVVREGRKLVGSAQRRTATALLQQGSVLLGPGHIRLADYLALPDAARERERSRLARLAADAGDVLGSDAPLERWAEALVRVLPAGIRRVDGPSALTVPEPPSYTAPSQACTGPGEFRCPG